MARYREYGVIVGSHLVIPGYNGIATLDAKHQVFVDAQAFGDGHEAKHVGEVIDSIEKSFVRPDKNLDIHNEVVLTADSGFHNEAATAAENKPRDRRLHCRHPFQEARSSICQSAEAQGQDHRQAGHQEGAQVLQCG